MPASLREIDDIEWRDNDRGHDEVRLRWPTRQELAEAAIINQLDGLLEQDAVHARVAQGPQFRFAFGEVAGGKIRIDVAGMAAQFGDAFPEFRLQHAGQALHADLLQMCLPAPLPVKLREITNRGVLAQRQAVLARHVEEMREQPRVAVQNAPG